MFFLEMEFTKTKFSTPDNSLIFLSEVLQPDLFFAGILFNPLFVSAQMSECFGQYFDNSFRKAARYPNDENSIEELFYNKLEFWLNTYKDRIVEVNPLLHENSLIVIVRDLRTICRKIRQTSHLLQCYCTCKNIPNTSPVKIAKQMLIVMQDLEASGEANALKLFDELLVAVESIHHDAYQS